MKRFESSATGARALARVLPTAKFAGEPPDTNNANQKARDAGFQRLLDLLKKISKRGRGQNAQK